MKKILARINKDKEVLLQKLFDALRIPSISAMKEHKPDMNRMADWLLNVLGNDLHLKTEKIKTKGNPLVYAESPKIPGKPTILFYGHYDVQPADPLDQWKSAPFEPEVRDGDIFCRGADDDKGQLLTHVFGVKTWLDEKGELPVQVKFIYEGEEEIGSDSLTAFLKTSKAKELLAADAIVVSDCQMPGKAVPSICYGLRGVVGYELTLSGPNRDLHSGIFGGSIANPAMALAKMLASITDENGVVQVPGFYNDVLPLSDYERKSLAELPFSEEESLAEIGMDSGMGEPGYSALERRCARPAFDINGLTSGYQGQGGKTIIPATASAKFTFRMVPNQDPKKLTTALRSFLKKQLLPGIQMKLTCAQGSTGMVVSLESPYIGAAVLALKKVFRKKPVFCREGGSIPVVAELRQALNADVLLVAFGHPDDGIHSPNEKFPLEAFYNGIRTSVCLIDEIDKV